MGRCYSFHKHHERLLYTRQIKEDSFHYKASFGGIFVPAKMKIKGQGADHYFHFLSKVELKCRKTQTTYLFAGRQYSKINLIVLI